MNLEDLLKRAWQSQFSGRRVVIKEGSLLQKLQREERSFRRSLWAGDLGMVLLCCVLLSVLGYLSYQAMREPLPQPAAPAHSLIWPSLLLALPLAGLGIFVTVDRFRYRRRQPRREDSVKALAESFLAQIDHRIRLFKNVFWWFILPIIGVADFGFRCYIAWWVGTVTGGTKDVVGTLLRALLESAVAGTAIFYLFRWLIKRYLQPRKEELQALLQNLER